MELRHYFATILIRLFYAICFRTTVEGLENIPKEGPAILCGNHISNFDPITMAAYIKRLPRYMAKKELFDAPVVGWLATKFHAFPVDRNTADLAAFKSVIQILKSGEMIGMFAQGVRVKPGEEKAAKAGVALFAMKGNAPVIPVAISGTYRLFSKLKISFGKPIMLEVYRGKRLNTETLGEITDIIMDEITKMQKGSE